MATSVVNKKDWKVLNKNLLVLTADIAQVEWQIVGWKQILRNWDIT